MLTAKRSLALSAQSAPELPYVPGLHSLYDWGVRFREGQSIMIAGRSGHQKSGFALWLVVQWGLPCLYLSADMNAFTASTRIAGMKLHLSTEQVEEKMKAGGSQAGEVLQALSDVPITFSYDSPITWYGLDQELAAYVELWNSYPRVIVVDNLMDIEGCDAEYTAQMSAVQDLIALGRATGAVVIMLHHATDKGQNARNDPFSPPSRDEVKNGLSEKPELSLAVALNSYNNHFRVAAIKQRMGRQDPTGQGYVTLQAIPEQTRFEVFNPLEYTSYI